MMSERSLELSDELVRHGMSLETAESIISRHGGDVPEEEGHQRLVVSLLFLCVAVKGICYLWCLYVSRVAKSEIANTLGTDHRNDIISNSAIIMVIGIVRLLEARGYDSPLLSKIDPAATFIMSLWIVWCWIDSAMEQVRFLSNRRVEDEDAVKKVAEVARQHLEGGSMSLHRVDVYYCGESFEARLEVFPRGSAGSQLSVEQISTVLQQLEVAVCDADVGVYKAHAKLRQPAKSDSADASWVAGYTVP